METFIIVILTILAIWLFFEFFEVFLPILIIVVLFKACSSTTVITVEKEDGSETESTVEELIITEPPEPVIEDSVTEKCIDGKIYLLIVENGEKFTATKEDTFGYPIKCSE